MRTEEHPQHEPIAIVGAGARMPGGVADLDTLWRLLSEGVDAVGRASTRGDGRRPPVTPADAEDHWQGSLASVDGFDADFFGISASEAERMDPQQRLVLEVAWEAIEDAGIPVEHLRERPTGVYLGLYGSDYLAMQLADPAAFNAYSGPGCAHSIAANRLSYLLDLQGPSLAVDTACSSSLVAVHLACQALRQGDCEVALAGGVNLVLSPLSTLMTGKVLPLAPSGRCRSFDAAADGIVRGEGCGIVVLERARDAASRGRFARALVRGTAVNQDGRSNGMTAPSPRAQREVLRRALGDAAADPRDVSYVEAHGTGTALGDPIELDGLAEVYGAGELACGLGSVKTNFGHLEAAAGIAGLLKAMLVLERRLIPPHLHLRRLNPEIDLRGTRFFIPPQLTPLSHPGRPALAAVSAFGFGGTNAHAVLEAVPAARSADSAQDELPACSPALVLPISARSPVALDRLAERYRERLAECDAAQASRLCAAAALRRTHHPHRRAVVGAGPGELIRRLAGASGPLARSDAGAPVQERPLAFVFTGQGSQWPAMGRDVLLTQPLVRREVEECDAVVRELAGWSLREQLEAPAALSRLGETEVAQLAIAALQLGLARLWRSWGMRASAVVGHSMGEIVAACAAGALDRATALEILLRRARIIERAARGGAMASVRLPQLAVLALLEDAGGRVGIAASNGPDSTVVAGDRPAIERFVALAERRGAKARRLSVDYAFHSSLLDGCEQELAAAVAGVRPRDSQVAIYSTVTGARIEPVALDARHWGRNLRAPVQLREAIAALAGDGIADCIEIGPHPVLLGDVHDTLAECGCRGTLAGSLRRGLPATPELHASLAELYNAGFSVEWENVVDAPAERVELPLYPWQRERQWLGERPEPAVATPPRASAAAGNGPRLETATAGLAELLALPAERRRETLTEYVRGHIAGALGLPGPEEVPDDLPLEVLGLDSLTVVELRNRAERELGVTVPLQALLDAATARGVAEGLALAIEEPANRE